MSPEPPYGPSAAWAVGEHRAAGAATGQRTVLYAVRSATALNRLLDALPVFAGDHRVRPRFTLVPGSDFGTDALAALDGAGARTVPWERAVRGGHDLVVAASPNGPLDELPGPLVLLPHGAGFNKRLPYTSEGDSASGLHPRQLLRDGAPLAALHALAHPDQLAALARESPAVAERAVVVGDPTLDRILASGPRRERYRDALGTGGRRLVAVVSTWGPESLLARRPRLPRRLTAELPYDAYQVALVAHPNVHSDLGEFALRQWLAPAPDAGLLVARPYEEWAAILVAADCVLTDHGSTALYAAAQDRPVIGCYDGGTELIPASPMAGLLSHAPRWSDDAPAEDQLDAAVAAYRPGDSLALAAGAFAEQGRSLERLRDRCYALLGLDPYPGAPAVRPLPVPRTAARRPTALGARVRTTGNTVAVARHPLDGGPHAGHVMAEDGFSTLNEMRSAGIVVRRARSVAPAYTPVPAPSAGSAAASGVGWTVAAWTARVLAELPGCRTAAAVLAHDHCVLRRRGAPGTDGPGRLLSIRIAAAAPVRGEPLVRADPAAVLCGVHDWLEANPGGPAGADGTGPALPVTLDCAVGGRRVRVVLASAAEGNMAEGGMAGGGMAEGRLAEGDAEL
ncbi:translation initiation factor 2 [Streptomyces paludis]|uniref:translation initiation factor 2 n=1 Tax=Streptomyces paludis TaxID=2282738 RepID=UPI0015F2E009|nr:translation initiation factor 2 [Streptomyces paludis]